MKTLSVGDLTFDVREIARRRTLEIIVDRDGNLVLATPPGVPHETLVQFVEDKQVWVYTKLEEKASQAQRQQPKEYVVGEGFYYLGRSYRLKLVDGVDGPPLRLYQGRFELQRAALPAAREHFIHWYTVHLRAVLDRTVPPLARRTGARPGEIHVQDLGYRWGSRGKGRHLYFHWRVALLPQRMIESVVAHELVHLLERSHNDAFWERLARVVPDYAERQAWLKAHGGRYDL